MGPISIGWAALGQVAGISLAFGVGIAVAFALGVLGLSRWTDARERGGTLVGYAALTATAFAGCAAAVGYGLYLLIPQLH
jgi:hypothetical protein